LATRGKSEQISRHEHSVRYRRYLKKEARRWMRRNSRSNDAPTRYFYRGYSL